MKEKALLGIRLLLGLIFVVFGANGLMVIFTGAGFIPMPPPKPEMMPVMQGLFGAIYLMPLVKLIQVVSGVMLLSGKYINLALTLLGPIVINILGIHLFLDMTGAPMAIVITAMWAFLLHSRWGNFKAILSAD